METGSNNPDLQETSLHTKLIEDKQVVINLRYDGLSMLIAEPGARMVLELFETVWLVAKDPAYLITEIQKYFAAKSISLNKAASVHWVISSSKFSLVPDVLFRQGDGAKLLNRTSRLQSNEIVHSDFWSNHDAVAIYALPQSLMDFIFNQFEKSTISHCGHSFNSLLQLQSHKQDFCHLQVSAAFAELFIVQNNKLIFFNQFPYQVNEDLLYMILTALEENRILAPELKLSYAGKIQKGDSLYKLLSTYIGEVTEIGITSGVSSAKHITPNQLRKMAHLIACL